MEALITKFEAFLLTEKRVAHNTFAAYKRDIAQYTHFLLTRKIALEKAGTEHIKDFLHHLHEQKLTAQSVSRKISSLKSLYAYLHTHHSFENHARDLITPKLEKRLPQYLTEAEVEQLLQATHRDESLNGVRNKTMIYLLYVSGMRISELVHVKKSAIHLDTGLMNISGKGGRDRVVPLPEHMLVLLRDYFETVHPKLILRNGMFMETEYAFPLFYGQKIKPISRQAFWIILKKIALDSNIKKLVSPHKLRHSLATHLLKKGADLRSLQLLLGHEQISTVQIYTHLENEHIRQVYDKKHPRS